MALQLVIGTADSGSNASLWLPVLERLSAAAQKENASPVVIAIGGLESALRAMDKTVAKDQSAVATLLQEGVAKLQTLMEQPVRTGSPETAPAREMSLSQDPELVADFIVESREHLVNI